VPLTSCHVSSAAFTGDIHLALQFLSGLCAPGLRSTEGWRLPLLSQEALCQHRESSPVRLQRLPCPARWHAQGHARALWLEHRYGRAARRFPDAPLYAVGYSM